MERKIFLPVIEPDVPGAFIVKSPRNLYKLGQVAKIPYIFTMTSRELELGLGTCKISITINHPKISSLIIIIKKHQIFFLFIIFYIFFWCAAFKFTGFESVPIGTIPLAVWPLAPQLLDYQGKVSSEFLTTMKIIRHYGGESYLSRNPQSLGQVSSTKKFHVHTN